MLDNKVLKHRAVLLIHISAFYLSLFAVRWLSETVDYCRYPAGVTGRSCDRILPFYVVARQKGSSVRILT